jgi:hypothetical protein
LIGLTTAPQSRGCIGDNAFLTNRTTTARVFLHDNSALATETDRLAESYVIDARFILRRSTPKLNYDLAGALPRNTSFETSYISKTYYLLMFNSHLTHLDFQTAFTITLSPLGYISFHWSPTIKTVQLGLGYMIWLDLVDPPPHTHVWLLEELAVLTSSFGLILAHAPINKAPSLERLCLAIATDNLSWVPRAIELFLNGRLSTVPIIIAGWVQEATPFEAITDTTPSKHPLEIKANTGQH